MTHDCTEALDRGMEVCTVFFDISKAFDSVPHLPLLMKLLVINVDLYKIMFTAVFRAEDNMLLSMEPNPQSCLLSLVFHKVW